MTAMNETQDWVNQEDVEIPSGFPEPLLWRVLVAPFKPKAVSKGGIILAEESQKNTDYLNYIGKVVAMGGAAYKSPRFEGESTFPQVGQFIVYGRYAGQPMLWRGIKLLLINDDEALAIVKDPSELRIYI